MPGTRFTDIRRFDTIDSTNRYLLDEARAGAPDGVVAVAEHQRPGGDGWAAAGRHRPGPICWCRCCSARTFRPTERHLASAVVALAAAEAAESVAHVRLGIKWPNDLLGADGRKVAGVLAEADLAVGDPTGRDGVAAIVVGIGST